MDKEMYLNQVSEHQGRLRGFIGSLHGYSHEVDDILQETNVTLMKKMNDFDESRSFLPWALSIARFTLLAHRKKRARDLSRLSFNDSIYDILPNEEDDLIRDEILYESEVERLRLIEMIKLKLGAKSRFVFSRLLDGKSCAEIGEEMGRSSNGVSCMRHRIIQNAKKILLKHKAELLNGNSNNNSPKL